MKNSSKIDRIAQKIDELVLSITPNELIYDLLRAYGKPKSTITRLKSGAYNKSNDALTVLWQKELYYQIVEPANLGEAFAQACQFHDHGKQAPRFIIVTDGLTLLARDTVAHEKIHCHIRKLANHVTFFLPWAGMDKSQYKNEFDIDIRATRKVARLSDEITKSNAYEDEGSSHDLNVFFSRLLYCLFAEDTMLFENAQFTNAIGSYTAEDGRDLGGFLEKLFAVLNSDKKNPLRKNTPDYLQCFPYVNGGAFAEKIKMPIFTKRARRMIIECGQINWRHVTPDIFGSMIQTIILPELRKELGVHYTSPENIHKVIGPLFIEELKQSLAVAKNVNSADKLMALLNRICRIKVFDPACGSGNFLIVSYNELRNLQEDIKSELKERFEHDIERLASIQLNQFYGIEINDFMQHVAIISLCMAEHLKNIEYYDLPKASELSLPLSDLRGNIVCANAARTNWEEVCPNDGAEEIYIASNPPYAGHRQRSKEQREDMECALSMIKKFKSLDYVSTWFAMANEYIKNTQAKAALVSTNSICQGQQAIVLWPYVFNSQVEIFFAYPSFKWSNLAAKNAGVTCSIIGMQYENPQVKKYLYESGNKREVDQINEYLFPAPPVFLEKNKRSLSGLQKCIYGSISGDNGCLFLDSNERENLLEQWPYLNRFIKRVLSGNDLLKNNKRYCLWLIEASEREICNQFVQERLQKTHDYRSKSLRKNTNMQAKNPHLFIENRQPKKKYLAIPIVSSEKRQYIPCDFQSIDAIALSKIQMIPGATKLTFGIISSKLMASWAKSVGGRMRTDISFSSELCYNTFPIPPLTTEQKDDISQAAKQILLTRAKHPDKNLAQLYDPEKMPTDLKAAHQALDRIIESCYQSTPFQSDTERLECLFTLYRKMVHEIEEPPQDSSNDIKLGEDHDKAA